MINILLPKAVAQYDMSRPPGFDNPTCGMGLKYARVEEALRLRYPNVRRVWDVDQVNADVVIVDPLWFKHGERDTRLQVLDEFLRQNYGCVLLFGAEQFLMVMPDELRRRLLPNVTWVTHCSRYQQHVFRTRGIHNSTYLSDPIPEIFAPGTKVSRVYTASQVNWEKRTNHLIEIYAALQYTPIETVFVGSATMWGEHISNIERGVRFRLQSDLESVCNTFVGNAAAQEVSVWANTSMHHVHVGQHDVSSPNQQEAALSGCVLWGMGHPLNEERPVYQYRHAREIVDAMLKMERSEWQKRSEMVREFALRHWSYEAFLTQFARLLQGR